MVWAWRSIEADFQRYYGLDLLRELRMMTYRRFLLLVTKLPAESATTAYIKERANYFLAEGR